MPLPVHWSSRAGTVPTFNMGDKGSKHFSHPTRSACITVLILKNVENNFHCYVCKFGKNASLVILFKNESKLTNF